MASFFTLLLAHLLADFPLQINLIARHKTTSLPILLLHIAIHALVLWLLLGFAWLAWPFIVSVTTAHFVIDSFKQRVETIGCLWSFALDQLAHLLSLGAIVLFATLFYPIYPYLILSTTILYPSLVLSLFFAMMVWLWLWINSLPDECILQNSCLQWSRNRLLFVEQSRLN